MVSFKKLKELLGYKEDAGIKEVKKSVQSGSLTYGDKSLSYGDQEWIRKLILDVIEREENKRMKH